MVLKLHGLTRCKKRYERQVATEVRERLRMASDAKPRG
jgi:hypothetical protein